MILDGIILALVIALLRGGTFKGFDTIKFRYGTMIVVLFALQLVIFALAAYIESIENTFPYWLMVFYSTLLILGWLNRHIPGFYLMMLGILLNMIVMTANGGKMPVSVDAAVMINPHSLDMLYEAIKHMPMDENTRLWFLGDIIPLLPPYPNHQVISLGDVLLNVGGFIFVWKTMFMYRRKKNIGGEII